MQSNWCTIALCFSASYKKYFIVLIDAVGAQMSPIISLFWKSHLTENFNFKLSRLPSHCIFVLYIYIHGVIVYLFSGSSIRNVWLLIIFLISFKVAFNQLFLMSVGNMMTSLECLGSGMKCDTSEPDSPMNYLIHLQQLEIFLCEPFAILFTDSSSTFHSLCACLTRSRIFDLSYLVLISGCM